MPKCDGGLTDCPNIVVFLGPHEQPALCTQHLADLLDRIDKFVTRNANPLKPKPNANYEVENADIEGILKDLGGKLGATLPAGWGFNLLIFQFGVGGSVFYISNAERKDMIAVMKEFIAKQEAQSSKKQ